MTGFLYRASWPILNHDLPRSVLIAEASRLVDAMAMGDGCRLVGAIRWTVLPDHLVAEAPAVPIAVVVGKRAAYGSVAAHEPTIRRLAGRGMSDRQIADTLACSEAAVTKVRHRARPQIPPGIGNPVHRRSA